MFADQVHTSRGHTTVPRLPAEPDTKRRPRFLDQFLHVGDTDNIPNWFHSWKFRSCSGCVLRRETKMGEKILDFFWKRFIAFTLQWTEEKTYMWIVRHPHRMHCRFLDNYNAVKKTRLSVIGLYSGVLSVPIKMQLKDSIKGEFHFSIGGSQCYNNLTVCSAFFTIRRWPKNEKIYEE